MIVPKYAKNCIVKSYEADCHGLLRLLSLMNYLQEAAAESADILGLGFEDCSRKGLTWFGSDYALEIMHLPRMHENFKIITWPSETKLWGSVRDFMIMDAAGNELIKASSQWVLIDLERRRPAVLKKYFPEYEARNERVLSTDFPKIAEPENWQWKDNFRVRFDDIDMNKHVNNAVYLLWASECVPPEFRMMHFPRRLEISFKKEAVFGEDICVLSILNGNESVHSVRNKDETTELSTCRIVWADIT